MGDRSVAWYLINVKFLSRRYGAGRGSLGVITSLFQIGQSVWVPTLPRR
jgi:hypothetical protein